MANSGRFRWSPRRIIVVLLASLGGVAGLIAVVQLGLDVYSFRQSQAALQSQDAAQAQLLSIQDEQLAAQQTVVALLAEDVPATGPTATAVAQAVIELRSTQAELEVERQHIVATLTAIPQQTSAAASSTDALASSEPQSLQDTPGVQVELLSFERLTENTLLVRLRYTNSGTEPYTFQPTNRSYLSDSNTRTTYPPADQSHGSITVQPDGMFDVWIEYDVPTETEARFLNLILPGGARFDQIPVP